MENQLKEQERITFEMSNAAVASIRYALALSREYEERAQRTEEGRNAP